MKLKTAYDLGTKAINYFQTHEKEAGLIGKFLNKAKEKVSDCIASYANTLDTGVWDNMVQPEDDGVKLSQEQINQNVELAQSFVNVIDTSEKIEMVNMRESIVNNPEDWGRYLNEHHITAEDVSEMQAKIDAGEDVPTSEIISLTLGGAKEKAEMERDAMIKEAKEKVAQKVIDMKHLGTENKLEAANAEPSSHELAVKSAFSDIYNGTSGAEGASVEGAEII